MKSLLLIFVSCFWAFTVSAQYAPQAGVSGSTAISATSSQFVGWATSCTIHRGYMDIANPSLGYVTAGDSSNAIGAVNHSIVSLGDSGVADLTFDHPIYNGAGPDFAVFENGFPNPANAEEAFLELAFVEVSSDGINYFRFPANSNTQDTTQIRIAGDYMNARSLNNLAGKYIANYGTPFDLEELSGKVGLDIDNITHVRIVDVVGSIGAHASLDNAGRKINDPYPTAIPTGGFDLDAVGAIHQKSTSVSSFAANVGLSIYPNPVADKLVLSVKTMQQNLSATLTDITGKVLQTQQLSLAVNEMNVSQYAQGIYYLILQDDKGNRWAEKLTKL